MASASHSIPADNSDGRQDFDAKSAFSWKIILPPKARGGNALTFTKNENSYRSESRQSES